MRKRCVFDPPGHRLKAVHHARHHLDLLTGSTSTLVLRRERKRPGSRGFVALLNAHQSEERNLLKCHWYCGLALRRRDGRI